MYHQSSPYLVAYHLTELQREVERERLARIVLEANPQDSWLRRGWKRIVGVVAGLKRLAQKIQAERDVTERRREYPA